jgi:MATE family multidrug resistance protein
MMATIFAIFFFIFHQSLPKIYVDFNDSVNFQDNMEVVTIASKLLLVAAIFQISDSAQVMILGALRGLQDVKIPTLITFISYWIVGFPISYFLGKEAVLGSFGIWMGLLAGLTTASILLFIRFNSLTLKLIAKKNELT